MSRITFVDEQQDKGLNVQTGKPAAIEFMNIMSENAGQAFVMLPKNALDELKASVDELKELVRCRAKADAEGRWVESDAARKMLGVSPKTWQTYRDSRVIPFSQFGRKIYVRAADIEAFLQSHVVRN